MYASRGKIVRTSASQAGLLVGTSGSAVRHSRALHISANETIAGRKTTTDLGLVSGNTVRSRNILGDTWGGIQSIFGGEIDGHTKLMAEARQEATARMQQSAEEMGADAVVRVQYQTVTVASTLTEILCYGTAVKLAP